MKKIIFILLSISALIGCTQKTNLVIGFEKKHGLNLPFDIAYEANFLSKNELSTKQFNSAKITLEKLNSDKIDLAILPFPLIWQANSNGANLQTISFFQREAGCLATRTDFLGKVGVIKNSLESIMLNELSKQDSLKYQVAYYQSIDKLVDDYDENMIDAICVKIPQLFLFKKLSDKIWLSDTFGSYPNYNIVTTKEKYLNNKEKIDEILAGLDKSCKQFNQDPKIARELIYEFCKIKAAYISDFLYETRFIISLDDNAKNFEEDLMQKFYGNEKQLNVPW